VSTGQQEHERRCYLLSTEGSAEAVSNGVDRAASDVQVLDLYINIVFILLAFIP